MNAAYSPADELRPTETAAEAATGGRRELLGRALDAMRSMATLSQALRIVGALVMLASMSVFLLQGWNEGNDIRRYLLLLAQTGLLTAGGLALSHGLRENRGARVFFGLALISVPANFTILGALIYSVVQWDGTLSAYPGFATWKVVGASGTALTLGGALLVLAPVTLFCLTVMARRSARPLCVHFLLLNALLLLPVRGSIAVGALVLAGAVWAMRVGRELRRRDRSLATPEGRLALLALFVPTAIMAVRSLAFYDVDALLLTLLFGALFVGLRQTSISAASGDRVAVALDMLSVPVAMAAALSATVALDPVLSSALLAPAFALVFAFLGFDVARRTRSPALATCSAALVSLLAGASFIFNALEFGNPAATLAAVVAGAGLLLVGRALGNAFVVFMACATALAGLLAGAGDLIALIGDAGWIELALLGAGAIAVGSVLDRHGAALRMRFGKWAESFGRT